jgi:pyruvate formate lyase activating enzyme
MMDKPHTPKQSLIRSRDIALRNGLHYVYTGNVHDIKGGSTWCYHCGELLVGRDWYELSTWKVAVDNHRGSCSSCGTPVAGVFDSAPGRWGAKRLPIRIAA